MSPQHNLSVLSTGYLNEVSPTLDSLIIGLRIHPVVNSRSDSEVDSEIDSEIALVINIVIGLIISLVLPSVPPNILSGGLFYASKFFDW